MHQELNELNENRAAIQAQSDQKQKERCTNKQFMSDELSRDTQ